MPQIHNPLNRTALSSSGQSPELTQSINDNATFASLAAQVQQERDSQAMRWAFIYPLSGSLVGQVTAPFILTTETGTEFRILYITGSLFSYNAGVATSFPIPNAMGLTAWAGDGLSCLFRDSRSGRDLCGGFIPMKNLFTPGYGTQFQNPMSFKYTLRGTSMLQFDVRNRDAAGRTHTFDLAFWGYKTIVTA